MEFTLTDLKTILKAGIAAALIGSPASAATFDINGFFDGGVLGRVDFDFSVTGDFDADVTNVTQGVEVRQLTSSVFGSGFEDAIGNLGYNYFASADHLVFGGLNNGVVGVNLTSGAPDFGFAINEFTSPAPFVPSIPGTDEFFVLQVLPDTDFSSLSTLISLNVMPGSGPSPIPVPASMPLLLAGIGALAFWRKRRG
jgi:hypothetical protein